MGVGVFYLTLLSQRSSSFRNFNNKTYKNTYTAKQRTHFAQLRREGGAGARAVGILVVRLDVDLPGRVRVEALVGGVAAPEALDQHGRGRDLAVEVLLALLLLHLERETGPEDALSG